MADAYKYLTGHSDDPLVAMNAVLGKHFPPGGLNLRNNNPFPLLDADKRTVTLGFDHSETDVPRLVTARCREFPWSCTSPLSSPVPPRTTLTGTSITQ